MSDSTHHEKEHAALVERLEGAVSFLEAICARIEPRPGGARVWLPRELQKEIEKFLDS